MGVEHALLPEKGIVVPGDLIIGADSHTCTYGALGAFDTGVGSTDLAAAMVAGECWFKVPESIRFVYHGAPPPWDTGKDLILHTIGDIGVDGARYMAMEFVGEAIGRLDMAESDLAGRHFGLRRHGATHPASCAPTCWTSCANPTW